MVRYKVRAHTEVSGPDRWAWLGDFRETPLGSMAAWSLDPSEAAECDGFTLPDGSSLLDPTPEQMAEGEAQLKELLECDGSVWDVEIVRLDPPTV